MPVRFLTEADQERFPQPQSRGFQIAGRPEQVNGQGVVVGRVGFHVEDDDSLAPRHQDALDRARQLDGLFPAQFLLPGINDLGGFADLVRLKELLSFAATGSALAVVHPVDGRHGRSLPGADGQVASLPSFPGMLLRRGPSGQQVNREKQPEPADQARNPSWTGQTFLGECRNKGLRETMRYLIDGYNLAHALGLVPHKRVPHGAETARRSLLIRLREAPGLDPALTTVVFDALQAAAGSPTRLDFLGFRVLFAHDQLADDLIEELIHQEADPRQLTVVSDDRRLKESAGRRGCQALGCLDFLEQTQQRPSAATVRLARNRKASTEEAELKDKPERLTSEELLEWQRCFGVDPDQPGEEW